MQFVKGEAPDLILVDEISEDEIYRNLAKRLASKKIYTYIGDVVLSVNPYEQLPIYGEEIIKRYDGSYPYQNEPHIYSLAESMYRELRSTKTNQCVLISGESGAGKTEASKKVMEYISSVSPSGSDVERIKTQLLASNPVLEAFGNAKTLRNDNSSRFGKYMELNFDFGGAPVGGRITNFLLEKVRITERAVGERAFHIFYFMLAGLSDAEIKDLNLRRDPRVFKCLAKSECFKVDRMDDKVEFRRVRDAMTQLNMGPEKQKAVWRVLAAILKIGNLEFGAPPGKDASDVSKITNPAVIGGIAKLLRIKPKQLDLSLISRTIRTGGKAINTPLNVKNAYSSRDAFCKALYSGLFDWVIKELNQTLSGGISASDGASSISVLDIYGFEIFEDNSFEQFCINWCNEKLQQYFIELTLKKEQDEYTREGIQWTPVDFFNNQIICDLIEKKRPAGILAILNEDSLIQRSTDMSFLEKLNRTDVGKHDHYKSAVTQQGQKGAHKIARDQFTLKHYAGDVTYKVSGFIEKNRDILFNDQVICIKASTDQVVKELFANANTDSMKRPPTSGTKFKASLTNLIDTLSACNPHYVRCIKPNERKAACSCDEERFRHQIRYLGLLENVRVRRAGFCNRQTYEQFLTRYKMTCDSTWPQWRGSPRDGVLQIINQFGFSSDMFREGKTKIFLRNPKELFALEEARLAKLPGVAVMIQRRVRGFVQRSKFLKLLAALKCQARARRKKGKKWILQVIDTFKGKASAENDYGMALAWPEPPSALREALGHLQRIQRTWRGTDIIRTRVPEDLRPLYRQKVLCYDIFHGNKVWQPNAPFKFNYLGQMPKFEPNVPQMVGPGRSILYCDIIEKMNPNGKMVPRAVILTDMAIFKLDPGNFKQKAPIQLSEVTKITLSTQSDSLVIVHNNNNRDHVLNFRKDLSGQQGRAAERYSEFVSCLMLGLRGMQKEVEVMFSDNITVNAAKKPGQNSPNQIQIIAGADSVWTKGKGRHTLSYSVNQ